MNYTDLKIDISYTSVGDDAFFHVLNPLLSCTKIYKRSVGFFRSSALDFIGDGILQIARNGGHIYLATSPRLSDEDIAAIKKGYDLRNILENRFISEFQDALDEIDDKNAAILCELIKEGILDIQIVRKNGGMYHDKLAVLEDFDGNVVACVGSNNESASGYNENYEKVRVYKSWNDTEGRVEDETKEFNSIWNKTNPFLEVYEFQEAIKKKVIERVENSGNHNRVKKQKYTMRPYQLEAKNAWINNGYKGFFVMATGTGKTITSLNSIKELIENNKIFTVIAVPYKHLVNQWYEDVKEFFPDAYIQLVYGEIKDAAPNIYSFYKLSKIDYKPVIVITTLSSFELERYEKLYDKISYEKLLIVDEAHNFVNRISDELSEKYPYKMGLSATPVFGKDVEKTELLVSWFGGVVFDFPIEKAIGKYLVNYNYYPIYVDATSDDEEKFGKFTSLMLSAIDSKTGKIVNEERFLQGYSGRLRTISMAEEKISRIGEIFSKVRDNGDHTIVYCSDGKLFLDDAAKDVRHLEYILKQINNALIGEKNKNLKASKFTATENADVRMKLIDDFNEGLLNYLVAIRCLDEGINIPSIKTALILSSNDNYREFVQRRGRILRLYEDEHGRKEYANIYDVIVCPSSSNKSFATIEFRRFKEYARLAINKDELFKELEEKLDEYNLTMEDIDFKNEYIVGGNLDE